MTSEIQLDVSPEWALAARVLPSEGPRWRYPARNQDGTADALDTLMQNPKNRQAALAPCLMLTILRRLATDCKARTPWVRSPAGGLRHGAWPAMLG